MASGSTGMNAAAPNSAATLSGKGFQIVRDFAARVSLCFEVHHVAP